LKERTMVRLRRLGALSLAAASLATAAPCGGEDVERGLETLRQEGTEAGGKAEDAAREAEEAVRDARDR
jgi:hypothetical protein